jgi:hypothetical protein
LLLARPATATDSFVRDLCEKPLYQVQPGVDARPLV